MKNATPWGQWEVLLDEAEYKVKRITVKPGERLSYQKHSKRKEHWFIVQGDGLITLNDKEQFLTVGQAIDIPVGASHRIANRGTSPLVFVEIQTGSYFGEDDIVRLQDDYGRND